ncbi:MAG: sigma factor [Pirellulales bacterium]
MNEGDRSPQPRARFDTTQWSVILRAHDASVDETHEAVSHLAEAYWYPLYVFSRRQGNSEHDAMDLTQGFFVHVLNGRVLETVSPEKGRFRSFLLAAFRNFMANQRRASVPSGAAAARRFYRSTPRTSHRDMRGTVAR